MRSTEHATRRVRRALATTVAAGSLVVGLATTAEATDIPPTAPRPVPPADGATLPVAPSTTDAPARPADSASCAGLLATATADVTRLEADLAVVVAAASAPLAPPPATTSATPGPALIGRASALLTRTASAAVPLAAARGDRADLELRCGLLAVAESTRGVDTRLRLGVDVPADVPVDAWQWPVVGTVTSPYGVRIHPVTGEQRLHTGGDIDADEGDPINPATAGVVIWAGEANGYGNLVIVAHAGGVATLYGHLSRVEVVVGDHVDRADVVGLAGSTGLSTGAHLHFEVRVDALAVDPLPWLPTA